MQIIFKLLTFSGVAAAVGLCAYGAITWSNKGPNKRPHIIFIVADDMGWNDVSFHGADQIPTPNIDALAYNGVILNRHYVQPICTPSRTALLTGRYPIREGMQGYPLKAGEPRGIPLNATLMPEYLRNLGYATNLVGKWHVGYLTEYHTPARRGFDSFYGYYSGFISYFGHYILQKYDNTSATGHDLHRDSFESLDVTYDVEYFTDLITDEAEKIIMANGNDKPLFLEIAHLAVHASSADDPLEVRDLTELNATFPYVKDFNRRKYAGMMKAMDDSVGRVVTALNDAKMLENSIIVFIADNGAPTIGMYNNSGSNYPLRGIKDTLFEGGVRGAACVFSPLIKTPSRLMEQPMHIVDWLPTLYAAAGGDPHVDLLDIDGQNQWPSLVKATASARQSTLLNIDEVRGTEGAIIGRYKLVKGALAEGEGYYGESGNDPSYPRYEVEDAMTSPAGLAISRLPKFISPSVKKMQRLREKSKVSCKKVTSYPNCSSLCLFDIYNDPCETHDLSQQRPKVVETLESFIDEYRKFLMPQTNTIVDICSLPKYFNGTWMPWRRKDIDYDTIPKGTCRHPEDLFKKNHTIKSY